MCGVPDYNFILSVFFYLSQTTVFWMLITALFLSLELINRHMVLFLPFAVASLVVAASLLPLPTDWPQRSLVRTDSTGTAF